MKKLTKLAVIFGIMAIISITYCLISDNWNEIYTVAVIASFVFSIATVSTLITMLIKYVRGKRKGKETNGYIVFGIINLILILLLIIISVWDLMTATGFMAGLFGVVGLCYGVPVFCIPLLVDIILYFISKRKKNKYS
ncbi:MAG: hypothetical protein IJZ16_12985 [Clostridia bacterium]|nr:hypothetical protein [Clostridia bacterium]